MGAGLTGEYGLGLFLDNLSVGGDIGFSTYRKRYNEPDWYQYRYTQIFIIPTVSYHFFTGKQFDPYGKVGLGLFIWKYKYTDVYGNTDEFITSSAHRNFEVSPVIAAGIRFWVNKVFILRAEVGFPFLVSAGFDFCIKQ